MRFGGGGGSSGYTPAYPDALHASGQHEGFQKGAVRGRYMTLAPALDLTTSLRGDFDMFWMSSLRIKGTGSCGIEAISRLAPHLRGATSCWGGL